MFESIYRFPSWRTVEEIKKGWSADRKFYIEDVYGEKLLLRLSNKDTNERKQWEFEGMKRAHALGVHMSKPIEIGDCKEGVYTLFSWVDGIPADEVIGTCSPHLQYELGKEAGEILRKLHSIPAPTTVENWEKRMKKKFQRHLQAYKNCGISIKNDGMALAYIESHLHLLNDRPQVYQHGDFHVGNLIVTPENHIGVIDFNRWDYGDPYEEFYKAYMFSREVSVPFVKGQLDGYFQHRIPKDFFALVALYLADIVLFSIAWAVPFGEEDVQAMIARAEMILDDYENFTQVTPKWLGII